MYEYFLSRTSSAYPIVGVEGYCCTWSRSESHTLGGTPPDERSTFHTGVNLLSTPQTQETNIIAPSGIRTRDPSNWAATELRLRPQGHGDRPSLNVCVCVCVCVCIYNYFVQTNSIHFMSLIAVWNALWCGSCNFHIPEDSGIPELAFRHLNGACG